MTARHDGRTLLERGDVVDIIADVLRKLHVEAAGQVAVEVVDELEAEGVHADGWEPQ